MSDEDAKSVVAYVRTLKPIRNQVPAKKIDFPVSALIKFAPQPLEGTVVAPDRATAPVKYGEYLTKIGGCYECHTPHNEKNQLVAEKAFSGGWEMRGPWGRNVTANLTPHPQTFVGRATRAEFIARFAAFRSFTATTSPACPKGQNTIMPWLTFSGMSDEDLGAIYDYLRTVKPVENHVVTFPDAAPNAKQVSELR
jgi:mono/diheme cytochrome c family protein